MVKIVRGIIEGVEVSDNVEWVKETEQDVKIPTVDRPKQRKMLIIMAISIAVSALFPLEDKTQTPFVILIAFFLSSVPLFIDDYITYRKRVKIHSNGVIEIL